CSSIDIRWVWSTWWGGGRLRCGLLGGGSWSPWGATAGGRARWTTRARAFAALGDDDRAAFHRLRNGPAPIQVDDPLRMSIEELDISAAKDLERAHFYRRLGETREALRFYRRAVETAPSNARARSSLGAILAETGDLDGAVDEMRKASRLAASDPAVIANLAEVHRLRGELAAAAAGHRRALELSPDNLRAHLGLARTLAASEHTEEAISHYEAVLEKAPGHSEAAAELQRLQDS
ncbi:MAG: tetratricopeptide repeat protein, partial [Acidobacteriota bacterium]